MEERYPTPWGGSSKSPKKWTGARAIFPGFRRSGFDAAASRVYNGEQGEGLIEPRAGRGLWTLLRARPAVRSQALRVPKEAP